MEHTPTVRTLKVGFGLVGFRLSFWAGSAWSWVALAMQVGFGLELSWLFSGLGFGLDCRVGFLLGWLWVSFVMGWLFAELAFCWVDFGLAQL